LPQPGRQLGAAPFGTEFSTANHRRLVETRLEQLLGGKVACKRPAACSPERIAKGRPDILRISCDDRLASALSIITLLAKANLERCHEPHRKPP
jgi:hypothetical protein